MALRPVCEYNAALGEASVPPVALVEWRLISGTRTVGVMPVVGEVSVETLVWDVYVSNERVGLGDEGCNSGSSK